MLLSSCQSVVSTWFWWWEQFVMICLVWAAIRSRSWLTRKDGGKAWSPPGGILMSSRHIGHLDRVSRTNSGQISKCLNPSCLASVATILCNKHGELGQTSPALPPGRTRTPCGSRATASGSAPTRRSHLVANHGL